MRNIDYIVYHCSASPEGASFTFEDCVKYHTDPKPKGRGWSDIGYHFYVERSGKIHFGRQLVVVGAHVKGYNANSIGVCYEGGLDNDGNPKDTRTEAQKQALRSIYTFLSFTFPKAKHVGHRDLSPDVNHDGVITPDEWLKACPCFDVATEL